MKMKTKIALHHTYGLPIKKKEKKRTIKGYGSAGNLMCKHHVLENSLEIVLLKYIIYGNLILEESGIQLTKIVFLCSVQIL
jgi:hypothetical protein